MARSRRQRCIWVGSIMLTLLWAGLHASAQTSPDSRHSLHNHATPAHVSPSSPGAKPFSTDLKGLRRMETSHFTLWTDTDEQYARMLARHLDLYHDAMHQKLSEVLHISAQLPPTAIVLFERQKEYQRFARRHAPQLIKNGGYYDGATGSIVTYRYNNSMQLYFHEILHALMGEVFQDPFFYRYTKRGWPIWFDEGLAEYFGSFRVLEDQVKIGVLNPAKVAYLVNAVETDTMVSLRSLLNSSTSAYNGERMNMFYAASWGLLRFLIENESYAQGLPRFVRALQSGTPGLDAFETSFGSNLEEIELAWTQWLKALNNTPNTLVALFNGKSIDDWTIHEGGSWNVSEAAIDGMSDGSYNYLIRSTFPREAFRLHLQVRLESGTAGIVLGNHFHGEYPYYFLIDLEEKQVAIRRSDSPTELAVLASADTTLPPAQWRNVDIEVYGNRLHVAIDGATLLDVEEDKIRYSIVGLYLSKGRAQFRDVLIGPPTIRPAAPGSVSP